MQVGLPPLVSMFNSTGTAYAADGVAAKPIESRFVFWFNGNGIPERYWIPERDRPGLPPLAVPQPAGALPQRHPRSQRPGQPGGHGVRPRQRPSQGRSAASITCTPFTGHGAGGPSIDQAIAAKIGRESRFSSIQIGVSQESFGESIQRNMSWAGYDRPLPPQMLPNKLFDYLFGAREEGWVNRKRSILDAVREDAADAAESKFPRTMPCAWRSTSRPSAIWSAPSPACPPSTAASIRRITTAT